MSKTLPESGYVRLSQFIPDILPISRSSWWLGVKEGRFPQPVKLGPRTTAWRVAEIRALLEFGLNWKEESSRG